MRADCKPLPRWIAGGLLLSVVVFGCARSEEVAWQPVTRLADHLEAPLPAGTPERSQAGRLLYLLVPERFDRVEA